MSAFIPNCTYTLYCARFGTYIINEDRDIISFGSNYNGKLGLANGGVCSPTKISSLHNIKMISGGKNFAVCLDLDGNVFSFGGNNSGVLGIGKSDAEIRKSNIPAKLDIPEIEYLSCGEDFTICLSFKGLLYSFGINNKKQLGIPNITNACSPTLIPNLQDICLLDCGGSHVVCKLMNGDIYAWGDNDYGQTGNKSKEPHLPEIVTNVPENVISIKCGYIFNLLLTSNGHVYGFGDNNCGQIGKPKDIISTTTTPLLVEELPVIKRIECGDYHSMCIDLDNKLWVFGYNECGQLGLTHKGNQFNPVLHSYFDEIIDISAKGYHTFVKTMNNEIYTFGLNDNSQLGITTDDKKLGKPIKVFNDDPSVWITNIGRSKQKSARK